MPRYIRRGYGYFGIEGARCYMPFLNVADFDMRDLTEINSLWVCL